MAATLLDGAAIAQQVYAQLRQRIHQLHSRGVQPGLAAILVGENSASRIYLKNKAQACHDIGVHSEIIRFPADCTEEQLFTALENLNADPRIHGILVLDYARVPIEGRSAVVIGRSAIVGKPLALMLIARGATVSVCSSKTPDLRQYTLMADILAVAVGNPGLVDGSMIKPGAVVIDVGINRLPGGKLVGDVDFASASRVASRITPVPGGVGRMTVAMLLENTVTAAERSVEGT
jgi:methylenetetrahydrofolate dehydrogenase (NADP+)/methenyltetrahydrofolate cyclohydrolase